MAEGRDGEGGELAIVPIEVELLQATGDAVIACDLDFIVSYWNRAAERLYGFSADEAIGKDIDSLLQRGRPSIDWGLIARSLRETGGWRGEAVRTIGGGSRARINATVSSILDVAGRTVGYVGVIRDVTEERRAGDELLFSIIDKAPYPVLIHDAGGNLLLLNRMWAELTGYGLGDARTLGAWMSLAIPGPKPGAPLEGSEREIRTRWGTLLTWSFSAMRYGSLSDGREAVLLCAVDTTARRRAERARQDNADRFSALAEVSPIGIVITRDDSVLYCNGAAERLLGLPPRLSSGLLVPEWLESLPPAAAEALRAMLDSGSRRAGPFAVESGTTRHVEAIAKLVEAAAGEMEMITLIDVTDRVLAEERERLRMETLVQTEKLASLGILVAGVAHEINNPNYTIAINADLLSAAWKSVLPIVERELSARPSDLVGGMEWSEARAQIPLLLSGIAAASRDIEAIVRGLKDYARAEENPEPEEVSVNLVIKAALALLSNFVKKATRNLSLSLAEDLPPARGHFQRLEQVVVNLVQNSCQALTDPSQAVEVATSYDAESGLVLIEVRDEGRGMGSEELSKIKVPFYTTKQSLGGIGLGVPISDSIVAEMGGRLSYESAPGAGTRALVSLKAARAEGGSA